MCDYTKLFGDSVTIQGGKVLVAFNHPLHLASLDHRSLG